MSRWTQRLYCWLQMLATQARSAALTWRFWRRLAVAMVVGGLVGAVGGWVLAQALHFPQVEALEELEPPATSRLRAADGTVLAVWGRQRRTELTYDELPEHLVQAVLAAEDAKFFEHGGVDLRGLVRAAVVSVGRSIRDLRLRSPKGCSTITMQLARQLFLSRRKSVVRKLKEVLLALAIEKRYSKEQIFTFYANQICLGHGAWGVESAAQLYFGRSARDLSVAQAALLAGMIQSPNGLWSPLKRPDDAKRRRDYVLGWMHRRGFLDAAQLQAAVAEPLGVGRHRETEPLAGHFVDWVRRQLKAEYGEELSRGGLEVVTTLDSELQRAASTAVRDGLEKLARRRGWRPVRNVVDDGTVDDPESYEDPTWRDRRRQGDLVRAVVLDVGAQRARLRSGALQLELAAADARWPGVPWERLLTPGDLVLVRLQESPDGHPLAVELAVEPELDAALLAIDVATGDVLAMVGGFDVGRSHFNCAVDARRQPGSAFKPLVLLTAMERGFTPADVVFDAPFLLEDGTGRRGYCPKNYEPGYFGITTLRTMIEESYNASTVKLQQLVGAQHVVDSARRFGLGGPLQPYPSLALGAFEVSLMELVRAYAGLAALGQLPQIRAVQSVTARDGHVRRALATRQRVASSQAAYQVIHVLRGVIERGTAAEAAVLPGDLAGKTGTTDNYSNAWFVGFSPRITVGVWVGYRDGNRTIGRGMTGSRAALPIWIQFMRAYQSSARGCDDRRSFPVPEGLTLMAVDRFNGCLPEAGSLDLVREAFLDGTEPDETCLPYPPRLAALPWPMQWAVYVPHPREPRPTAAAVTVADVRLGAELPSSQARHAGWPGDP